MMKKYQKKPLIIEAVQWFKNGDYPDDNCRWIEPNPITDRHGEPFLSEGKVVRYYRHPDDSGERQCEHCANIMHEHGWIETLEGGHIVCPSDWIIKGIAGELYPCKDGIFKASYDLVEEDEQG